MTAIGSKCDLAKAEKLRTGEQKFDIKLDSTDIKELADKLYNLPRDLVSDGYDAAINAIKNKFKSIKIHSYPSDTQAFTWIVPERWICHNAGLYDTQGNEIFSTKQNGLHVMRYSLPLDKEVSRKELFDHLYTPGKWANDQKNAVAYAFKFYERDWGLCCSNEQKSRLNDERYRVKIDSVSSYGELKVGEWHIQGKSSKTIILCEHLDHPYQFNDDLSGVITGLKVMESLAKHKELRYSYKLLLLPETIGSACYLSHNEKECKDIIGGIFLEVLATNHQLHLMHSNTPDSYFDTIATLLFKQNGLSIGDFVAPGQLLNDERMFNALNIPMISIQRIGKNNTYYPQYHTDQDTPKNANKNLDLAIKFILNLIDIVENDAMFIRNFKGELFVSSIDELEYSKDSRYIRELTFCNEQNLSQIAIKKNLDFKELLRVAQILKRANLASLEDVKYDLYR
ncbi:DUF4910 domain-containing protein [Campylobacter hyointestinalis]|uniref:DUF4910 domain-containing protein n=1 Tax=Campylobacter hyointestinalis TaxID=198 RepID=UPI0021C44CC9|nr:DUF4910 domain-containing protein [Campylobacter hyointestinalis]